MANATQDLDTPVKYSQRVVPYKMAAVKIYAGTLVCVVTATGYAQKAGDTVGTKVVGRAMETVDNSAGAAGDKSILVDKGCFGFNASAGLIAAVQANIEQNVTVVDDNTVGLASETTNDIVAGVFEEVGTDGKYYVRTGI